MSIKKMMATPCVMIALTGAVMAVTTPSALAAAPPLPPACGQPGGKCLEGPFPTEGDCLKRQNDKARSYVIARKCSSSASGWAFLYQMPQASSGRPGRPQ